MSVVKPGIPQLWANSANKFFHALAAGRPIAINYGGWQAELIEETGAGLVLSDQDIEAAADQLTCGLHDSAWLTNAVAAAARLGRTRFDRDRLASELERVLINACNSPASKSNQERVSKLDLSTRGHRDGPNTEAIDGHCGCRRWLQFSSRPPWH